jgi:hypothetical protein
MPITHSEVVSEVAPIEVGIQNETILVDLVRVVGDEAYSSCKGILGNHIPLYILRSH